MKVVFLGDSISTQQAGIHYYGLQLVKRVVNHYPQHSYCIISSSRIEALPIPQEVVPINPIVPFHMRWRQIFVIPKIVRQMKPDIVVELAHFGPFSLGSDIGRVTVIHDLTPILFPQYHPYLSVLMHRLLLPGVVRRADFLVVNSKQTKSDVVRVMKVVPESIHIVEPQLAGIPSPKIADEIPIVGKYFLTVGTCEPRKDHITILRAFELFCVDRDDFSLIIVGKIGWKNAMFEKAYEASPVKHKIELKGFVERENLVELYRGAFAYIQASLYEGFGIPLIEAQAYGLPLLVAGNKSVPEAVLQNSMLFEQSSAKDLLLCMNRICSDHILRSKMSNKSREAFLQHKAKPLDLDEIFGNKNGLTKGIEQPT